jgi:hypothetical protein
MTRIRAFLLREEIAESQIERENIPSKKKSLTIKTQKKFQMAYKVLAQKTTHV